MEETNDERLERMEREDRNYDAMQKTIAIIGLPATIVAAATIVGAVIVDAQKSEKRNIETISKLCEEVDRLECNDGECKDVKRMKKTCSDFRAGTAKHDYSRVARKLSEGLKKSDAKPPKMKSPQKMRMSGPSVK